MKTTTTTITILVGPYENDDGFVDYLLGEIDDAIDSTDSEGIPVIVTTNSEGFENMARAVLTLAANGGMPDSFWLTDGRIASACVVLGWTPEEAREWAFDQ